MKSGKSIELTYEEVMNNPAYERIQAAAHLLHTAKFEEMFPQKNLLALKGVIVRKLKSLRSSPTLYSLKDAVTLALHDLPDDISASIMLELTRYAIEEWEKLTEKEEVLI